MLPVGVQDRDAQRIQGNVTAQVELDVLLPHLATGLRDGRLDHHDTAGGVNVPAECVRFEKESFGALHQMLSGLDQTGREQAWQEITEQLAQFEGPQGFEGPCEMLVVTGTR